MQPERLRTMSTTNMADCWRENFVGIAIPRCEILSPVLRIKAMLLAFQNFIRRREHARKVRLQKVEIRITQKNFTLQTRTASKDKNDREQCFTALSEAKPRKEGLV